MPFIVLGLGADPRMFTGLSEGPGGSGLPVEEPIVTYKDESRAREILREIEDGTPPM
jgi:hypothetical protein